MVNDFIYWQKENEKTLEYLKDHNSQIYDRLSDVIRVLNHIAKKDSDLVDPELSFIFDEGYAYLYDRFNDIKNFINDSFNGDLDLFLSYEPLVYYSMYIDDLHDCLVRDDLDLSLYDSNLKDISEEINNIISSKGHFDNNNIDRYNMLIEGVLPSNDEFLTTPEIFSRILDELILEENKNGKPFKD